MKSRQPGGISQVFQTTVKPAMLTLVLVALLFTTPVKTERYGPLQKDECCKIDFIKKDTFPDGSYCYRCLGDLINPHPCTTFRCRKPKRLRKPKPEAQNPVSPTEDQNPISPNTATDQKPKELGNRGIQTKTTVTNDYNSVKNPTEQKDIEGKEPGVTKAQEPQRSGLPAWGWVLIIAAITTVIAIIIICWRKKNKQPSI